MSISAPDTQPVQAYPKQAEPMASFATSMQVVSLGNHREHTWRLQQQESMSQREVQALRLTQRIGL